MVRSFEEIKEEVEEKYEEVAEWFKKTYPDNTVTIQVDVQYDIECQSLLCHFNLFGKHGHGWYLSYAISEKERVEGDVDSIIAGIVPSLKRSIEWKMEAKWAGLT